MANITPPEPKLEPQSQPWGRWVTTALTNVVSGLASLVTRVAQLTSDTAANLNRQQAAIIALNDLTYIRRGYFNSEIYRTGTDSPVYPTLANVILNSTSGRLEVGYGGALRGGTGAFMMEVRYGASWDFVAYSKEDCLNDYSRTVRITNSGTIPVSGWVTTIIDVPIGVSLQVNLWTYRESTSIYYRAGSIMARPVPALVAQTPFGGPSI